MSKLPKITSLVFLGKSLERNEWSKWFFACRQAWKLATNWYYHFDGMVKHSQSFRNSKFVMSLLFLKKEVEDEVGFLHVDKHIKISFKLISTLLASKFPSRWYYHYWWVWSCILKVNKVTSLKYFTASQKRS